MVDLTILLGNSIEFAVSLAILEKKITLSATDNRVIELANEVIIPVLEVENV